jgi:anti-sigma B factor antagonist
VSDLSLLSLSVFPNREYVTVVAAGEIDLSTSGQLETQVQELWAAGWTAVDIDLHRVSFMDSSGLHALARAMRTARDQGTTLTITDGSEPVRRLLTLTCMDEVLPIRPRTEAA